MITAKYEVIEVPVTTTTQKEVITLTMSLEMAQFLVDVTGKISGCPNTSRRKYADQLRKELLSTERVFETKWDPCTRSCTPKDMASFSGISFQSRKDL